MNLAGTALTPRDATMYWLSTRTPNDLFLLYAFAETAEPTAVLRRSIADRVTRIPDLLVRVLATPANIAYPIWATCEFLDEQVLEHEPPERDWGALTTAVGDLLGGTLDAAHRPWRLHLFRNITAAPGFAAGEPALIAVLQLSHALADGRRAATLARALFTDSSDPTAKTAASLSNSLSRMIPEGWPAAAMAIPRFPIAMARTVFRGFAAYRAEQRLAELTSAGVIPPPARTGPPNLLNGTGSAPAAHTARMLVHAAPDLKVAGHTVTVIAATAISLALQRYLDSRAETADSLLAQVPMAVATDSGPRNSYRDLTVDLSIREPNLPRRADRIAADMSQRRHRAEHPLQESRSRATAAIPAPILRRDIMGYPMDQLPQRVSGHTVISSVHRGPADLSLAGGPVRFTAGFPAIGSVMRLTHGIHGLGNTITLSLHADPATIANLDTYAELLNAALAEAVSALRLQPEM
ncbi:wax ester/triacylglycerol synthase domain-containing protein [Nocardia sp. NPDC058058]|uniref:wax ester/triacylglycerol synthase domain-containing protein n=1 Tax=Nocardia sp. NPDC058058 TaxID=3346317 RepID=UPI0036DB68EC